jgi:hypothetical protein
MADDISRRIGAAENEPGGSATLPILNQVYQLLGATRMAIVAGRTQEAAILQQQIDKLLSSMSAPMATVAQPGNGVGWREVGPGE